MVAMPQSTMMALSHVLGATLLMIKLLGTSNKIYGTKKTSKAML